MQISLDETQLEDLKDMFGKMTKSFSEFSKSIKALTLSINKLTEKLGNK